YVVYDAAEKGFIIDDSTLFLCPGIWPHSRTGRSGVGCCLLSVQTARDLVLHIGLEAQYRHFGIGLIVPALNGLEVFPLHSAVVAIAVGRQVSLVQAKAVFVGYLKARSQLLMELAIRAGANGCARLIAMSALTYRAEQKHA